MTDATISAIYIYVGLVIIFICVTTYDNDEKITLHASYNSHMAHN